MGLSDRSSTDLQDERLQKLQKENNTLKDECRRLKFNLEVTNEQFKIHNRVDETIGNYKEEVEKCKKILQNEKDLTKERDKLSEDFKELKKDFARKEAELKIRNIDNDCLSKHVKETKEELSKVRTEKLLIENEYSREKKLFNEKFEHF